MLDLMNREIIMNRYDDFEKGKQALGVYFDHHTRYVKDYVIISDRTKKNYMFPVESYIAWMNVARNIRMDYCRTSEPIIVDDFTNKDHMKVVGRRIHADLINTPMGYVRTEVWADPTYRDLAGKGDKFAAMKRGLKLKKNRIGFLINDQFLTNEYYSSNMSTTFMVEEVYNKSKYFQFKVFDGEIVTNYEPFILEYRERNAAKEYVTEFTKRMKRDVILPKHPLYSEFAVPDYTFQMLVSVTPVTKEDGTETFECRLHDANFYVPKTLREKKLDFIEKSHLTDE